MYISIDQALTLWTELERAREGTSSYAGDTTEIYAYTLMPSNPAYTQLGGQSEIPILQESFNDQEIKALQTLLMLCRRFEKARDCRIYVKDFKAKRIGSWFIKEGRTRQRWHFLVKKSAK